MEDVSAAFAYSQVIFLNNKGVNLSMENLVTVNTLDRPISFRLTSSSNQMVTIELFDMMGKLHPLTTQINEGQNNMEFNTINIPKGMYILLVKNNSGEELVNKIFIE
ncbi:MAG: T9SS type A sorting domain-containing protein [Saprospiraceae bacterium]|nr:T9SS type A sorting domain-containing protein [Candidatus Brachybacter algidus]